MLLEMPVPQAPTLESEIAKVKRVLNGLNAQLKMQHTAAYNMIWNNPYFPAQEIVNAFGADAIPLFQLSSALQDILAAADPGYEFMVPDYALTIHTDGSIELVPRGE